MLQATKRYVPLLKPVNLDYVITELRLVRSGSPRSRNLPPGSGSCVSPFGRWLHFRANYRPDAHGSSPYWRLEGRSHSRWDSFRTSPSTTPTRSRHVV